MDRYSRNLGTFSAEECGILQDSVVGILGLGGLGGYVLEILTRIGVGTFHLYDFDVFSASNLNRQILALPENLGRPKVQVAKERALLINQEVEIQTYPIKITAENARAAFFPCQVLVDALDSIPTRFVLESTCNSLQIPWVHGAVGGFYGQVATVFPNENLCSFLYPKKEGVGMEQTLGVPSFIPPLIASLQVAEVVKLLVGKGELLRNQVLFVDCLTQTFDRISIPR